MKTYINMPNCIVPADIAHQLQQTGGVSVVQFGNKDDIIINSLHHMQCGYSVMPDNSYYVAMYTPMPHVTAEMVQWWFWWHAQHSDRYRAWYPSQHIGISYAKRDKQYFSGNSVPEFRANRQFPTEKVGKLKLPLCIDFVTPSDFGFSQDAIDKCQHIVCGHVGAFGGLIANTDMAHMFVSTEQGLLLVSRFWLGKNVKSKLLKKMLVTEHMAKDMAEHCCVEYRNFASRIPHMYRRWLDGQI